MVYTDKTRKLTFTQQQRYQRRCRAKPEQSAYMLKVFRSNPRPDQALREHIGRVIDMTPRSVQIWFQNRRAKLRAEDRRMSSLRQFPLTTSKCGNNVSRVHIDMESLGRHASQIYGQGRSVYSAPDLLQSLASMQHHSALPSRQGTPSKFMNKQTSSLGRASSVNFGTSHPTLKAPSDLDSLFEDNLGLDLTGSNTNSNTFDATEFLNIDSNFSDIDSSELESPTFAGTDGSFQPLADIDASLFDTYDLWKIKIGSWGYDCRGMGASFFEISDLTNIAKITIDFHGVSTTGPVAAYNNLKAVIESQIVQLKKHNNHHIELVLEAPPIIYLVDEAGQVEHCTSDFTNGEAFLESTYHLIGDFSAFTDICENLLSPVQPTTAGAAVTATIFASANGSASGTATGTGSNATSGTASGTASSTASSTASGPTFASASASISIPTAATGMTAADAHLTRDPLEEIMMPEGY